MKLQGFSLGVTRLFEELIDDHKKNLTPFVSVFKNQDK